MVPDIRSDQIRSGRMQDGEVRCPGRLGSPKPSLEVELAGPGLAELTKERGTQWCPINRPMTFLLLHLTSSSGAGH